MLRLGLCCKFYKEPIKFRTSTAKYIGTLSPLERLSKLSFLCLENAKSLLSAIEYCGLNNIGCFRVTSQILPLKTHPEIGYNIRELPNAEQIKALLSKCREQSLRYNVRLSFHPGQFVVLSSPNKDVVRNSILELDYQAEVGGMIGADVINIHGGGSYSDKVSALKRMSKAISQLDKRTRDLLAIENDDRVYAPMDLLPFCKEHRIPFVYDIHHHRCFPDKLGVKQVTESALKTWNREPLFHISSPKHGWNSKKPCFHSNYINAQDFPAQWRTLNITVEVEAKAKELAVKKLYRDLGLIRHKKVR